MNSTKYYSSDNLAKGILTAMIWLEKSFKKIKELIILKEKEDEQRHDHGLILVFIIEISFYLKKGLNLVL